MRRHIRTVGGLSAGLIMGATAVAVAAIPDSATSVISACLKSKEGTIRIVDFQAGKRCLAGETLISWNQKGPQGAAGVQGLPGTPGAPGVAGTQGLQGPTGPAGSAGADGAPGADGVPGPAGPRGDGNKTISGIIDIKNSVTTKRGSGFDVSCSGPAFGYETNCTITFPADTWGAEGPVVWAGLLAANQPSNPPAWPGQGQVGVRIDSPTVVQLHTAGGYAFPQTIQFTAIDLANTSAAAATPLVKASNWGTLVGFSTSPRTPNVPVDLDSSTDWATLTAGQSHSCGIKADRSLWCWGDNFYGELGLGTQGQQTSSFSPARVGVDKDWSSIAAGLNFSCGTKTDHTLWCWGMDGVYGNLGIGLSAGVFGVFATPVQVTASRDWLSVVANMETACALKTDHSLWCWGSFESFDNGVQPFRAVPTAIDTATNWSSISLGGGFCGIKSDATLWCAGQNRDGQLGDGTSNARITPTRIGQERSWRNVSSGSWHTCAVAVDSSLWCWGQGSYGALGDGAIGTRTLPNQVGSDAWLQVSAGWGSTCGIKTDHTLWCWGYNGNGSAGVSSLLPSITTPTQVGTEVNWSLVVKSYQHAVGLQTYAN